MACGSEALYGGSGVSKDIWKLLVLGFSRAPWIGLDFLMI